jgi:hypothetical protein
MNPNLKLAPRTFPARVADLGFTANLPTDWINHELPKEEVDFSNPTLFMPLAIVTAPHAAIVFAFAARPAYDDGTLHDWAWYHLNHNQLQPRAVGRDVIAGVAAVSGEAVQQSDLGPMVVRFAFLEDGNRLINLMLTAPEIFADSVRDAWFGMLKSFALETPRGSRFQIEAHADNTPAAQIPEPWLEKKTEETPTIESEVDADAGEPSTGKCKFSDFALEADTTSLDQATTINANLRDRGVGLVPNIVAVTEADRRATVAAGAIMAQFDVPYGWHVIDDGKRTLIFEPSGKVQINLNLIPREGRSNTVVLDDLEAQTRADYPNPEFGRIHEGKIHALGVRNIADGTQPLEQYHMLYPFRDDSMVLRARVTATPEQAGDACHLAELILDSCAFDCFQLQEEPKPVEPSSDGKPAWWHEALALEAQDQLEAAEKVISDGCPYIGFAYSTAEMYRLRMLRLMKANNQAGALAAFQKSSNFIFFYASMATSGGEGTALAAERDQFRAQLVAEYGSDPEAVNA